MQLHTISKVKTLGESRLQLVFDGSETRVVDLVLLLRDGGPVFAPLRNPKVFKMVELGPRGRTILWHVDDDVVDLCADALWLEAHPEERRAD